MHGNDGRCDFLFANGNTHVRKTPSAVIHLEIEALNQVLETRMVPRWLENERADAVLSGAMGVVWDGEKPTL